MRTEDQGITASLELFIERIETLEDWIRLREEELAADPDRLRQVEEVAVKLCRNARDLGDYLVARAVLSACIEEVIA